MAKRSAGLLLFRRTSGKIEVLLAHPGGPLWMRKDAGAWTLPKGEIEEGEDPLEAAKREFEEETGFVVSGTPVSLGTIQQRGGKLVQAWAIEQDVDAASLRSNSFTMEWPPRSGKQREFPEIDRAAWFSLDQARSKILPSQTPLLGRLEQLLAG